MRQRHRFTDEEWWHSRHRGSVRSSGEQPIDRGNNRTKEDRLSQRWLFGKHSIDLFGGFPAFGEIGRNHAEVIHFLGDAFSVGVRYHALGGWQSRGACQS
jgi:hypothetical protein